MGKSESERVLDILEQHKKRINSDNSDLLQWIKYSADLSVRYIGPDAQLTSNWFGLMSRLEPQNGGQLGGDDYYQIYIEAKKLIDICINSLKDNGLYKPEKSNFLNRFNDAQITAAIIGGLITVILATIGFAWTLGTGFNQFRIDRLTSEVVRLEAENKALKNQLDSLNTILNKKVKPANADTTSSKTKK